MNRQIVEQFNDTTGETDRGWFDLDRAQYWDQATRWDGSNMVSAHTTDPYATQRLYRTAGGRWVLNMWSRWEGTRELWEYIEPDQAREWLVVAGEEDAIATYFPDTPDEVAYGRPEVGPQVAVRMPEELRDRVDKAATTAGVTRAEWIRNTLEAALA